MTKYLEVFKILLGISNFPFIWKYPIETQLEYIADLNFRYIELVTTDNVYGAISPKTLDEKARKKLRELTESYNLKIHSLSPAYADLNLVSPNPRIRKEVVNQIKWNIELASDVGAKIVIIVPGKRYLFYTTPVEKSWSYAKEELIKCSKFAEDFGIICAVEQCPFGFLETSKELKKMVEEIGSESAKAMTDTANARMRESPADAIRTLGEDLLVHVHMSDCDGKNYAHLPIGMSNIDFTAVAKALDDINYKGVSMLEIWVEGDPKKNLAEGTDKLLKIGWKT